MKLQIWKIERRNGQLYLLLIIRRVDCSTGERFDTVILEKHLSYLAPTAISASEFDPRDIQEQIDITNLDELEIS